MNIMRVTWTSTLGHAAGWQEDFIFHKQALLTTTQRILERRHRRIIALEFFPGDTITEDDVAKAILEDRFIGH